MTFTLSFTDYRIGDTQDYRVRVLTCLSRHHSNLKHVPYNHHILSVLNDALEYPYRSYQVSASDYRKVSYFSNGALFGIRLKLHEKNNLHHFSTFSHSAPFLLNEHRGIIIARTVTCLSFILECSQ